MDIASEQKSALALLGLTAAGCIILAALTTPNDYGFIFTRDDRLIWSITRIYPSLTWLSLAGVLVLVRSSLVWSSSAAAFLVALLFGSAVAVLGAPIGINPVSIMATVTYYAIIAALLCVTIKNPVLAALVAPVFLVLQVAADAAAHVGTGVLQIA